MLSPLLMNGGNKDIVPYVIHSLRRIKMNKPHDLSGQRFGRLQIIEAVGIKPGSGMIWRCKCDCGTVIERPAGHMHKIQSCGCLRLEKFIQRATKHGMSRTRIFRVWSGIKWRCLNPNNSAYKYYGGRGITICDRWLSFENFLADMGEGSVGLSIDRIDGNKGYEPGNCVWATQKEQMAHTGRTHIVEYMGRTQTLPNWCKEFGIPITRTRTRLSRGLPLEAVFTVGNLTVGTGSPRHPGIHRKRNDTVGAGNG